MSLWNLKEMKFTVRHFIGLGIAMVLFVAFTIGAVEYTNQSSFCGSCHEMSPMYTSWTHSSHKEVACAECHEEPGFEGTVKSKAKGTKEAWLHLTGNFDPPKAEAKDVNCYSCHQDKVKTAELAADRKDPHTQWHFENGMNCLTCHSGIVHTEGKNQTLPTRDNCYTCHLDQMQK